MSSSSLLMLQQSLQELTQVRNRFTKTFSAQFISSNHYTHNCSLPVTHTLQEHCAQLSSSLVLLGSQIQINYSVAASATLGEKKKTIASAAKYCEYAGGGQGSYLWLEGAGI